MSSTKIKLHPQTKLDKINQFKKEISDLVEQGKEIEINICKYKDALLDLEEKHPYSLHDSVLTPELKKKWSR